MKTYQFLLVAPYPTNCPQLYVQASSMGRAIAVFEAKYPKQQYCACEIVCAQPVLIGT
jgi:hypothetical protein